MKSSDRPLILLLLLLASCVGVESANAQRPPTADGSLGSNPSQVIPAGGNRFEIDGGATQGSNLFHSFREFNVPNGGRVDFRNPTGIDTIFSRVTGGNPSQILGTLGVLGDADLFFLNPNGIVFGENAQLDVNGAFLATTADAFQFGDRGVFSAQNPQPPSPLLTIAPSALWFRQADPAGLSVRSSLLTVPNGESLTLVGGDVVLNNSNLQASGGRIALGAVGEAGQAQLTGNGNVFLPTTLARGDITLRETAINVVAADEGDVALTGRNIRLTDGSSISAGIAEGQGTLTSQAGDVRLNATEQVVLTGSSFILNDVSPDATGNSGDVQVTTAVLELLGGSELIAGTSGNGNAGNVVVRSRDRVLISGTDGDGNDSALISDVIPGGRGIGGFVIVITDVLTVENGGQLNTDLRGQGRAGDIFVRARERITLRGTAPDATDAERSSGAFSTVRAGARGRGGNITLNTPRLEILDGARVDTGTQGEGRSGNIRLNVDDRILISGTGVEASGAFSTVGANANGDGGIIEVSTRVLEMNRGTLDVGTFGLGDAGGIFVDASDRITLRDSTIFSDVLDIASGDGSLISINTRVLELRESSGLFASTSGNGDAGSLSITARDRLSLDGEDTRISTTSDSAGLGGSITLSTQRLSLTGGARILTRTAFSDAGTLNFTIGEALLLRNNSLISTEAGRDRAFGNGGNIIINNGNGFIISVPDENSDLVANAFEGDGGNIQITSQGIFGLVFRDRLTPQSDITASSQFGLAGIVNIDTPGIDPTQGVIELPTDIVDAASQIGQVCPTGPEAAERLGRFVITGRGGITPSPLGLQEDLGFSVDWMGLEEPQSSRPTPTPVQDPTSAAMPVEATDWQVDTAGQVQLVNSVSRPDERSRPQFSGCP